MGKMEELAKRLEIKKQEAKQQKVDWKTRKDDWLESLKVFFADVKKWLRPLVEQKLATVREVDTHITEENLGTFTVPTLSIQMPDITIQMKPVGTIIVGARGRVDILAGQRRATILLLSDGWKIAEKGERGLEYTPLTEGSFADLLEVFIA
jgi:hypothetical protein